MAAPKKYGLILPKSGPAKQAASSSNVFGDDSDDEHSKVNIEDMIKKESKRNLNRLETQLAMQKALEEDANVFEYDEIYDDMKAKKEEQDLSKKVITKDRKPKYIDELLKNAAIRKREEERRQQRKIQKEREDEKEEFGDKEAFVTSSYKKKMEEMKLEEEEAKRREQLEAMMDVTKQKDLSGFYRHMLKQQCGEEKIPDQRPSVTPAAAAESAPQLESASTSSKNRAEDPDADTDIEMSSDGEDLPKPKRKTTRTYRKRKQQSDSEDEPANADADESIEESSSESEDEAESKRVEDDARKEDQDKEEPKVKPEPQRTPKDWKKLFEKRCVGEKFESARERYLERQEARQGVAVQ